MRVSAIPIPHSHIKKTCLVGANAPTRQTKPSFLAA
jgi:hypothetical protein